MQIALVLWTKFHIPPPSSLRGSAISHAKVSSDFLSDLNAVSLDLC